MIVIGGGGGCDDTATPGGVDEVADEGLWWCC